MLRVLYCSNPLAPAEPEPDFATEAEVARRLGLPISLIDHDALERDGDLRRCLRRLGTVEPGPALRHIRRIRPDARVVSIAAPHFLLQTRAEEAVLDFVRQAG